MRTTKTLWNAQQAHKELLTLWAEAKPWLLAGHRLDVSIRPAKRSSEANARLHALLSDVSAQKEWAGRKWDTEDWKRLMVAAWMREKSQQARLVPAIDGHGFDVIYARTSEMSGAEVSELMSYVEAWGAENGVEFTEPVSLAVPER